VNSNGGGFAALPKVFSDSAAAFSSLLGEDSSTSAEFGVADGHMLD
jgi:hypothetical protein